MSQYGFEYRMSWLVAKEEDATTVTVSIYDTSWLIPDVDAEPIVHLLQPSGNPFTIRVIDNDRTNYGIKAKSATIEFLSEPGVSIDSFADSYDNQWLVVAKAGTDIIFKGYLVLTDSSQPMLPDPQVVQLTASDHLGLLKDIDLTDSNGDNPTGYNRIADYLTWALAKTGLSLDLEVVNNIKHGGGQFTISCSFADPEKQIICSNADGAYFYPGQQLTVSGTSSNNGTVTVTGLVRGIVSIIQLSETVVDEGPVTTTFQDTSSDGHLYDKVYLEAKTFEKEIGVSINCYDVISYILQQDAFLTQYNGKWRIMRPDEWSNSLYMTTFDTSGQISSTSSGSFTVFNIGSANEIKFCDASQLKEADRPNKFAKLTYEYRTPLELICNMDFSRGDLLTTVDSTDKHYEIDCWTAGFEPFNPKAPNLNTTVTPYIRRRFNSNDYEIERYVVLPNDADFNYLYSEPISLLEKDKISVSIDYAWSSDKSGSGSLTVPVMFITLIGDNGSNYYLHEDAKWYLSDSTFSTNSDDFSLTWVPDSVDETKFRTISIDSEPLPTDGQVQVTLINTGQDPSSVDDVDAYFNNLQVTVNSFINGSYTKYSSQYSKVERTDTGYLARTDEVVNISDSPAKIYKGAMFFRAKGETLYTGSIQFSSPDSFVLSGDVRGIYLPGTELYISSSTNPGFCKVVSTTYHIIGNTTDVFVEGLTISTVTESGSIYKTAYKLTKNFWNSTPFGTGNPPDATYFHPYDYIRAYGVFNQHRKAIRTISGTVYGLKDTTWPDLVHRYILTDYDESTYNRYFQLISFEQNWKTCKWEATFREVWNTEGFVYTDPFEFKYVSNG